MTVARSAPRWPIFLVAAALCAIVAATLAPYGGNVSALFHADKTLLPTHPPAGFVVLEEPAYDGMQYYQLARNMPDILRPARWETLRSSVPGSYAYQRFLLPLLAWVASLGQDAALPFAFLAIECAALLCGAYVMLRHTGSPLSAWALAFCPAAMIGLHFSLAEPLALLLTVAFLVRYDRIGYIDAPTAVLLVLLPVTREVYAFFVAFMIAWSVLRGRWRDAAVACACLAGFACLHALIYAIFEELPFFWSTAKRDLPFASPVRLFAGSYDSHALSSIALFLGFVLPATLWIATDIVRRRRLDFLPTATLAFLLMMLAMPGFIWGSITSIGRVITPVYPLFILTAAARRNAVSQTLQYSLITLGLLATAGLILTIHAFTLSA